MITDIKNNFPFKVLLETNQTAFNYILKALLISLIPALVIDNGCVFQSFGLGNLVAFDLDTQKLHFYPRVDKL